MSDAACPATADDRLFAVKKVRDAAGEMSRPLGRVLRSFWRHRFERLVERFIGLLFAFDPADLEERDYESIDESISEVIALLKTDPENRFYRDAIAKMTEAQNWIAQGFSPSKPPSAEELDRIRDAAASDLAVLLR